MQKQHLVVNIDVEKSFSPTFTPQHTSHLDNHFSHSADRTPKIDDDVSEPGKSRSRDEHRVPVDRRRHIDTKEEKFKNKYRWAEKQQKLRSGKSEGYSFNSLKAGLHRQDYRDTLQCSPILNAKPVENHNHLADLVKQLIIHAHGADIVQKSENKQKDVKVLPIENIDERWDGVDGAISNIMDENDWQLARKSHRKPGPLRVRGSNTLSSHMNLDAFIDLALSGNTNNEEAVLQPAPDLSLTDLQSPKLIESRFTWTKVRLAVTTASVASKLTLKTPVSPLKVAPTLDITAISSKSTTTGRPSTASETRPPLDVSFHLPSSVGTTLRPKSAIVVPSKNACSIIAPVHDFAEALVNSKSAQNDNAPNYRPFSSGPGSAKNTARGERPSTAKYRMTASLPPETNEVAVVDAMMKLVVSEQQDTLASLHQNQKLFESYDGLFYKDSSRNSTWHEAASVLSPAPYITKKDRDEPGDVLAPARSDLRWAGKTMNCYRPWSPVRRTTSESTKILSSSSPLESPRKLNVALEGTDQDERNITEEERPESRGAATRTRLGSTSSLLDSEKLIGGSLLSKSNSQVWDDDTFGIERPRSSSIRSRRSFTRGNNTPSSKLSHGESTRVGSSGAHHNKSFVQSHQSSRGRIGFDHSLENTHTSSKRLPLLINLISKVPNS